MPHCPPTHDHPASRFSGRLIRLSIAASTDESPGEDGGDRLDDRHVDAMAPGEIAGDGGGLDPLDERMRRRRVAARADRDAVGEIARLRRSSR